MDPVKKERYLPTLDGWRAIAILMVVASHLITKHSANQSSPLYGIAFRMGTLGVMLFFAISGFLICTRLLIEEESQGSISLRSFYIRRVFRILPAAYVYLGAMILLGTAGVIVLEWRDILGPALFYANYQPVNSWNTGHYWSLSLEEHFYILWPPMLVLLGRSGARWACVGLICLTAALRVWVGAEGVEAGQTHLRLDAFLFPCLMAITLRERGFAGRFKGAMKTWVWLLIAAITGMGLVLAYLIPAWKELERLLQSAVFPTLIAATVLQPDDWLGRCLRLPALEWLGRISYSIYLWQQVVVSGDLGIPLVFQVPLILLMAVASERLVERPMIALGKKFAGSRTGGYALP